MLLLQWRPGMTFFATSGQSFMVDARSSMNYALPHLLAAQEQSTGHAQRARPRSRLHFTSQPARPPPRQDLEQAYLFLAPRHKSFEQASNRGTCLASCPKRCQGCHAMLACSWHGFTEVSTSLKTVGHSWLFTILGMQYQSPYCMLLCV
ncbi:hypothetical protein HBI56_083640 [Parastagonospora nodorum]|uniref:Uncharacterized protein n=1 Tax=Phaeosphaeria nodorum (strain SN15 / ATCC MYA-4574 / FGSC 10173) TaxID=321614 RepID=A0A7U2FK20_PHANO|nr:hypothetical protein HBH56_102930 [Parastagonospora nodorum]QRD04571.1 hypothetical protein JI435_443620 [Parastagonospora nodorum SN15]KAH3929284.1 hypothetical protein HBH54_127480 [Parastagonospora nodorum]KAH3951748.1 hypothetical protein HBH53_061500 [Parastagonospora nodorum]KAH4090364.1 hypothetical protein HBH46_189020 [Parastagonospora nodorum]